MSTESTITRPAVALVPPAFAQPLERLAGLFYALCQIQDGAGCLSGSMPGALRSVADHLRRGDLSQEKARYAFTSCSQYLQHALGSMLWKEMNKGPATVNQWSFSPDEKVMSCLRQMADVLQELAGLIAPFEQGRGSPTVCERLMAGATTLRQIQEKPELTTFHQGMSYLSMAFTELSLAV